MADKKPPKPSSTQPGPRTNPLDRPVMTVVGPKRHDPLRGPFVGLVVVGQPEDNRPQVSQLDLTAHVLHEEHVLAVIVHARTLNWAEGSVLKVRPANPEVGASLGKGLREALGWGGPRLVF